MIRWLSSIPADLMLVSEDGAEGSQVSPKAAVGEAYGGSNYPWLIGVGQETIIAVMIPSAVEEGNFSLFLFSGGAAECDGAGVLCGWVVMGD